MGYGALYHELQASDCTTCDICMSIQNFLLLGCAGMTLWSTVFASLGAAARNLVTSGMSFSSALAEVTEDAGELSQKALVAALILGIIVLALQLAKFPSPLPAPLPDAKDVLMAKNAETQKAGRETGIPAAKD
jgi:hypothetical protein